MEFEKSPNQNEMEGDDQMLEAEQASETTEEETEEQLVEAIRNVCENAISMTFYSNKTSPPESIKKKLVESVVDQVLGDFSEESPFRNIDYVYGEEMSQQIRQAILDLDIELTQPDNQKVEMSEEAEKNLSTIF
ncbi:MAG: hypothetical protein COV55_00185 [Candidatus Komeilibacteria bacterium CG11_big_fil_rev_8_21_14_0_20_36_20]|uniref:Uncharacterized protein n=1 Tax=Candidatus Komeilibacteria bacterium CG11_big_fil_rev_8_21_14_0_20_36_20 TaxID=1974477 RepID=A0A2H0NGV5_9BACT|nr:MAG: hypothetical protein COV55_00185 [Candidatus Komeilibacteria bacterium CG11_big_fil_rev_8_21_14_0_20_36_20]PIR81531.1 MAG: hypothetical protein COU21_03075 [Candidatus Komeilibacteria bacterium CG10_big_fil_rev_8_21_14_0_10_36_65]PJC55270.1 MAG: hypothetical protein CO027_02985 [Candidatus Komeilibacteria bacterium CG_4_9_14_0_2_um_filter_36_13]